MWKIAVRAISNNSWNCYLKQWKKLPRTWFNRHNLCERKKTFKRANVFYVVTSLWTVTLWTHQLLDQVAVIWPTECLTSSNFLSSSHRECCCSPLITLVCFTPVLQADRLRVWSGLVWFGPHGERACLVCRAPHLHAQVFTMRQTEQHHPHSHRRPGCGDGGNGKWTKFDFKCFF